MKLHSVQVDRIVANKILIVLFAIVGHRYIRFVEDLVLKMFKTLKLAELFLQSTETD